ncbi:MAG TPA: CHAD domain-containing protein [Candidatus Limnocylindrales bacterium]|nr:CHAD domain-containing protein [Candidatus Limnocylindrales bacterium]
MTAGSDELGEAPAPLRPGDSFRAAARAAMWPQVARMLEVEAALRESAATDALKRYRVATRRLRAALRVFEQALPRKVIRAIQPELGDLARAVGRVRDLDVRIAGLNSWAAADAAHLADVADVEPLLATWAAERLAAARDMEKRLDGKGHARLLDDLSGLVRGGGADTGPARRAVRDRAGSAVWAGFERLRAAADGLDGADLEALHDVRILAKRLRYTIEFLAPVLGSDREWLVARLVNLQDHLGALHDADLARAAAQAFLDASGAVVTDSQRTAIETYGAAQAGAVEALRSDVSKVASLARSPLFAKRLARAILGPAEANRAPEA